MKNEIEELRNLIQDVADDGWRKIYMEFLRGAERGVDGIETDVLLAHIRKLVVEHRVKP